MKAVVVDLKGKYAAVMSENGAVVKVPNANYAIGQKIELHEVGHAHNAPFRRIASVAIAAALVLSVSVGTVYAMPYGTVSLDSDSAIEYTINRFDRVIGVQALNEGGKTVLEELSKSSLKHRTVEKAIQATVDYLQEAVPDDGEQPQINLYIDMKDETHADNLRVRLSQWMMSSTVPDLPQEGAQQTDRQNPAKPEDGMTEAGMPGADAPADGAPGGTEPEFGQSGREGDGHQSENPPAKTDISNPIDGNMPMQQSTGMQPNEDEGRFDAEVSSPDGAQTSELSPPDQSNSSRPGVDFIATPGQENFQTMGGLSDQPMQGGWNQPPEGTGVPGADMMGPPQH